MTESYKILAQLPMPGTEDVIYEVPLGTQAIIKHMLIVNVGAGDRQIWLWHSTADDAYVICPPGVTIVEGGMAENSDVITLNAEDTILGKCSVDGDCTMTIYGVEVSA